MKKKSNYTFKPGAMSKIPTAKAYKLAFPMHHIKCPSHAHI